MSQLTKAGGRRLLHHRRRWLAGPRSGHPGKILQIAVLALIQRQMHQPMMILMIISRQKEIMWRSKLVAQMMRENVKAHRRRRCRSIRRKMIICL